MKLSKKSWLIIGVGIFLIALAGLLMVYTQQSNEKNQLKEEANQAASKLASIQIEQLAGQQEELQQQLKDAIAQSKASRKTLSLPMNSIIITDTLFSMAESNSVNITNVNSSGLGSITLQGVPCWVLPLSAHIEGEMDNLVAFITQLNENLATGIVRSINMNIPDGTENQKASASIEMAVHAYKEE